MKRQRMQDARQGQTADEERPSAPASKRQPGAGAQGPGGRQRHGSGQVGSGGAQSAGAGRHAAHSPLPPLATADPGPEASAGEAAQEAAASGQEEASPPSKAEEAAAEEAAAQPAPAKAAKHRRAVAAARQQEPPQQAAVEQPMHGSMQHLADAAAAPGSGCPATSGGGQQRSRGSREGARCLPAAGPLVRGPTFRLARGEEPPCFRVWLTLQAPCTPDAVTGGLHGGRLPVRHAPHAWLLQACKHRPPHRYLQGAAVQAAALLRLVFPCTHVQCCASGSTYR